MLSNAGSRAASASLIELCARADCFAHPGFVEEAEGDRYVAGRLRSRAGIDRVEAAELWRSLQCCSGSPLVNHWRDSIAV
jgi:hypothetical protein